MPTTPKPKRPSAIVEHRRRLRSRGLQRIEVHVRSEDAPLVPAVAAALTDPDRASKVRALLRCRFGPQPTRSLKDLLAAGQLDDIDLERSRDTRRTTDL